MNRKLSIFAILLLLPWLTFAQTKEAQQKYDKAYKEVGKIDRMKRPCPRGQYCGMRPPNLAKAEKWLKEALIASPDFVEAEHLLGDIFYIQSRWDSAAAEYLKAKELDSQQHKLSRGDRDILFDQLGLSQAEGRHLDDAIKTYTEALKENPDFTLFEYNLACSYAENGDLRSALPHLKKAWALKDNLPAGTPFPDPQKDDSFKKYWDDQRFKDAVENMVV